MELVLPVPVDRREPASGAATAEVEPPHILAVSIQRHAHGDLKALGTTGTSALLEFCVVQEIGAVADGMVLGAGDAMPNGRAFVIVELQLEDSGSTGASRLGKVVGPIAVSLAIPEHLLLNVRLALAVSALATLR
jgi:hypothetical protein